MLLGTCATPSVHRSREPTTVQVRSRERARGVGSARGRLYIRTTCPRSSGAPPPSYALNTPGTMAPTRRRRGRCPFQREPRRHGAATLRLLCAKPWKAAVCGSGAFGSAGRSQGGHSRPAQGWESEETDVDTVKFGWCAPARNK